MQPMAWLMCAVTVCAVYSLALVGPQDCSGESANVCWCTSAHWRHRMQLLAFGFVSSRTAYFRDPWNWMDAAIVALICIDSYQDIIWFIERNSAYIASTGGVHSINVPTGIKVLRALRALRPLRWVLLRYL